MSKTLQQILEQQSILMTALAKQSGLLTEEDTKVLKGKRDNTVFKHQINNLSNTSQLPFNEDSFFFDCNLERPVCNFTIQPISSLLNILPVRSTRALSAKYAMLTQFDTTPTGTLPDEPCDPGEVVGQDATFCKLEFPLGRRDICSNTMEVDRLIATACQNAFDDFFFLGDVRGTSVLPSRDFNPRSTSDRDLINRGAVLKQMQYITREHQIWMMQKLWTGDPTNNTPGGGYREPLGLLTLVNSNIPGDAVLANYLESSSGQLADCAAMNSDIKDFGSNCIGDPTNNPHLWALMQELEDTIWNRAFRGAMLPAQWVWVMPSTHWSELMKYLPCQIMSDGCTNVDLGGTSNTQAVVNIDTFNLQMREEFRSSMTLTINGRTYPVVLDDAIPYTLVGTQYESSIFFLPLSMAGEDVFYVEHLDYRRIAQMLAPLPNTVGDMLGWTDDGRYHHTINFLRRCFEICTKVEPRWVFKGTRFAGRIDNVGACPLQNKPIFFPPEPIV